MKYKKILTVLLAVCFTVVGVMWLSSCSKDGEDIYSDDIYNYDNDDSGEWELSLENLDGWWVRPDGYEADGISLVDYFRIDASAGTWTIYNSLGEEILTYGAELEDGWLSLEFDLGDIYYEISGDLDSLWNEYGEVDFVRGEALAAPDRTSYDGKWYEDGKTGLYYYVFNGNTYKRFLDYYSEDEPMETGTYTLMPASISFEDGTVVDGLTMLSLECEDDGWAAISSFYISDDKTVLQAASGFNAPFYVHESAIGTPEGENNILKYGLMKRDWSYNSGEGSKNLEFSFPNIFRIIAYPPGGGYGETESYGTFEFDDYAIYLNFSGSESDTVYLSDTLDSITFEGSGEIYNKW